MTNWTQGPWAVDPMGWGAVGDVSTVDGNRAIAQAQPCQPLAAGKPDTERAANAHLIAAAPELYEALEMCVAMIAGLTPMDNGALSAIVAEAADSARKKGSAALAKARGEA